MDEMALLQQIPLFAGMPGEDLGSLVGSLNRRTFDKGQIILHQGEPGDSLYIVVSGRVRIYTLSPEGHELCVNICDEGDFFGEMAILSGEPRSACAEAMQTTKVLVLHRQTFRDYLLAHPRAAIHTVETLSRRLRRTTENAESLVSLNVTQRIARQLLELIERYGLAQPDGVLIDLDLSQEAIATMVGTTRESANRALSAMRDQGILEVDRSRIRVLAPHRLQEMLF
jgi:CRP/FNR family transcriptional regulator/CRP/FNR family cyclic AMP-dependent transcriptional regulator